MEPWSPEWKELRYAEIKEQWAGCKRCGLCTGRKKMAFGEGALSAKLMFIGEGPGEDEDKEGRPFVGRSGKLLTAMLGASGLTREEVFLDNIVICRPPENRNPLGAEREACLARLYEVIYLVDPLLIVATGKVSLETLAGRSWSIEAEHGNLFSSPHPDVRVAGERNGVSIPGRFFPRKGGANKKEFTLEYDMIPIFHPSYILRQDSYDEKKDEFSQGGIAHKTLEDLAAVVNRVKQLEKEYYGIQTTIERMTE